MNRHSLKEYMTEELQMSESVRMTFVRSRNKVSRYEGRIRRVLDRHSFMYVVGSELVYILIVVFRENMETGDKMGVRESILWDSILYIKYLIHK